ncbi:PREDICTED: uncharacterized protein LOC109484387 [Branchiostoma belcheri]|uniref:Uncharacterized protein LOC109484387 n=1 Tax=Branchiostoma belcheri TaxID=7741 RepID=A0A6P4ZPT3_BRABE|nr:PREDICTED: uncharacterized protein LOC109484387 [Branchiostoma belcheri]
MKTFPAIVLTAMTFLCFYGNASALVNTTRVVICTGVTCALPTSAGCYRQYLFNSTLFDSQGDIPTNNTAELTSEKVHVCSSHPWRATSGVPKTRNSIGKIGWIIAGAVVGAVIIVACGCIFCSKKKK